MCRRDNGLPYSAWLRRGSRISKAPVHAMCATVFITTIFSILNLGNETALHTLMSLAVSATMGAYIIVLACTLRRRMRKESLPYARWSLGKAGLPINCVAFAYVCWSFFWCLFSGDYNVTATNFNWALILLVSMIGLAFVALWRGYCSYEGPRIIGRT